MECCYLIVLMKKLEIGRDIFEKFLLNDDYS
ncbi:hypothetical protein HNP36_000513 [Chryseobacterium shigense]|uniref:Uncharacterized protein n=1 Tax=Chryseobacterium shigense TaxID=297244 RepID=A0A841N7M6_9FLAO|nr:hypothetical protein [Chryseobacterium shigense]